MNGMFYEQLGGVTEIFEQWGACERTVVACALARRVPWPGLKLVQRTVEAALQNHVIDEGLERDANDEAFLTNLLAVRSDDDDEECESRLGRALSLVPLLRVDNSRGAAVYVRSAPGVAQRSHTARARSLVRQLLAYLLVHPALSPIDHISLTEWVHYLENPLSDSRNLDNFWQQSTDSRLLPDTNIWGSNSTFRRTIGKNVEFRGIDQAEHIPYNKDSLQESFSKNGRDVDLSLEEEKINFDAAVSVPKSQRSNSLTPPSTDFLHLSSSAENLSDELFVQKPRSFSLSSEHSLGQIRPIGVMFGTTGSETRLDDLRSNNFVEQPGMSTVAQWLKSLRLHKYIWLFTNISYEQMIAMDDEYLEKSGVTKGARHKLLLSIAKLQEREAIVAAAEAELVGAAGGGSAGVARVLERLRSVVLAPMEPRSALPSAVVRVLQLASCRLRADGTGGGGESRPRSGPGEEDAMALHCWLVEKALHHSAFSAPLLDALRALRHRLPPTHFFHLARDSQPRKQHQHQQKHRWPPRANPRRSPAPPAPRAKSHSYPPYHHPHLHPHHPHLQHHPHLVSRQHHPLPHSPADDYSGLDALCLQMTEQAIN